ncbi:MAG: pyridoxal-phosphate dependent enzyme [candidate division Zixibacteria bacterium]|nr:pyridoxal-phosphate dependent enzyme [candidate division Zixibacteria bacterium]
MQVGIVIKGRVDNVLEAIGQTPLVSLHRVIGSIKSPVWAKVEFLNPGGSIKDRMAIHIIDKAEKEGRLKPGGTIVENTSGNTGVGVAMVAAVRGYRAIFTMPDKMSTEKINLLKAYGAKVVITPTNVPADSPESYYETAKRIHHETPGSFYLNQYHNPDNIEAHYVTTGPEIWEQTDGQIDCFIAGIGTGGTLSGAGRYLKEKNPNIKVIAVDPEGSVFYDWYQGKTKDQLEPRAYKVEGIGEDMVVEAMDFSIVDDMVQVDDKECFNMARRLTTEEGLFGGGSSGGAVAGLVKYLSRNDHFNCVVTVLPDSGTRYLSKIFSDEWMRDCGFLDEQPSLGTVDDMLADRHPDVITADADDKVFRVIETMKTKDISQLPVLDNGNVIGVINESDLLNYMVTGSHRLVDPIRQVVIRDVHRVSRSTTLADISEAFSSGRNMALVVDNDQIAGIITRIDLIDYLAKTFKE